MKEVIKKIYFCGYCNKLYQIKHACEWHEKHCRQNPSNKHKCFEYCPYLIRGTEVDGVYFQCKRTKEFMYSYIAERRKLPCVTDGEHVRMPLDCSWYRSEQIGFEDGQ